MCRRFVSSRRWASPFSTKCFASRRDRKSTRLNSSHLVISYAVFCLKKKREELLSTEQVVRGQGEQDFDSVDAIALRLRSVRIPLETLRTTSPTEAALLGLSVIQPD